MEVFLKGTGSATGATVSFFPWVYRYFYLLMLVRLWLLSSQLWTLLRLSHVWRPLAGSYGVLHGITEYQGGARFNLVSLAKQYLPVPILTHRMNSWDKNLSPNSRVSVVLLPIDLLLMRKRVLITATVSASLQLINLGSTTAFQDLTSITVAGLYSSYLIAVSLLLWRRCRGNLVDHDEDFRDAHGSSSSPDSHQHLRTRHRTLTNDSSLPLTWGPVSFEAWKLLGKWLTILDSGTSTALLEKPWIYSCVAFCLQLGSLAFGPPTCLLQRWTWITIAWFGAVVSAMISSY